MADLTTQPYKGTRDFYPEEMRLQRYIFNVWKTIAERFGYEEVNAPLLELTELYLAKTGEEIVNEQAYNFTDRGGREVTIRPEMTPSMARMVAAKNQELSYPLRWYSIANFWRYERPQRGRFREHWQLNVDMFGESSVLADAEIIRAAESIMKAFGASEEMYTIRVNSRQLTSLLLGEHLKLDVEESHRVSKLLDRKDKMTDEAFAAQLKAAVGENADKLMNLLSITSIDQLPATVIESGMVEELRKLFEALKNYGIENMKFDLTLMRGFDYYTGMVFEVFDNDPENNRAIFGGGRYDGLTNIFKVPNIAATGFGMGDAALTNFLTTHKLLPEISSSTKVYLVVIGDCVSEAQMLARELRQQGINVALDMSGRKADVQLKVALKKQIPYVLFVGEKEVKAKKYNLKDLNSEKEQTLSSKDIIAKLG